MGKRANRRRKARGQERRRSFRRRVAAFTRQLFGGLPDWPDDDPRWDRPVGGVGVREPLHPRPPTLSGAVALEPPPHKRRDVRAVADG
jgi:hypothetical protein